MWITSESFNMTTYGIGTKVFCDFHFGGKPKGKVVEIIKPGNGKSATQGQIVVELTETVGAYRKGERLTLNSWLAVPCAQEFKKRGSCFRWVNTDYCFQ